MSVDPAAAGAAGGPDLSALLAAELRALAADAAALRGMLVENAVVSATVLPSNGLTDLLQIAGLRVAASLPPTVRPGDVITVQVTGFDADRILLQILGSGQSASVESEPSGAESTPAGVAGAPASAAAAASPAASTDTASAGPPSPAPFDVPPEAVARGTPGAGAALGTAASRAAVGEVPASAGPSRANPGIWPGGTAPAPPRAPIATPGPPTTIEARLAAARAALLANAVEAGGDAAAGPSAEIAPGLRGDAAPPPQRFVAPPQIVQRATAPAGPAFATAPASAGTSASPAATATTPRANAPAAFTEPAALLRALRIAVTPTTIAAARLALEEPGRLPNALAALERALPANADDPSIATLRTLLPFVGRIAPDSPALAVQLEAYVDQIVAGAEPKLATLLAALDVADAGAAPSAPATPPQNASPQTPPPPNAVQPPSTLPSAVAAERAAALDANVKQTLLALAADPATPAALSPAIAGALTAITSVQLNAAQLLAARPDGFAFTLPLATANGPANAQIRVERDAGGGGASGAAPNFRIAFVLETAHYGTVAIDVVTVGREVSVDVRTEAAPAMRAFRDALGRLTERLEGLRYRVASAGASVGATTTVAIDAPPARPPDPDAAVDRSA